MAWRRVHTLFIVVGYGIDDNRDDSRDEDARAIFDLRRSPRRHCWLHSVVASTCDYACIRPIDSMYQHEFERHLQVLDSS